MAKTRKAQGPPPRKRPSSAIGRVVVGSSEWEQWLADAKKLPMLGSKRHDALRAREEALRARLSAADIRELIRL